MRFRIVFPFDARSKPFHIVAASATKMSTVVALKVRTLTPQHPSALIRSQEVLYASLNCAPTIEALAISPCPQSEAVLSLSALRRHGAP